MSVYNHNLTDTSAFFSHLFLKITVPKKCLCL